MIIAQDPESHKKDKEMISLIQNQKGYIEKKQSIIQPTDQ